MSYCTDMQHIKQIKTYKKFHVMWGLQYRRGARDVRQHQEHTAARQATSATTSPSQSRG
uniref:Uncharacterized protein n=1 Tax=Arundo donax TaxID=35708 RepID=A0A0A9HK87_ARUDO